MNLIQRGHFYWALKRTLSLGYNSEKMSSVAIHCRICRCILWRKRFAQQRLDGRLSTAAALAKDSADLC